MVLESSRHHLTPSWTPIAALRPSMSPPGPAAETATSTIMPVSPPSPTTLGLAPVPRRRSSLLRSPEARTSASSAGGSRRASASSANGSHVPTPKPQPVEFLNLEDGDHGAGSVESASAVESEAALPKVPTAAGAAREGSTESTNFIKMAIVPIPQKRDQAMGASNTV